MKLMSAGGVSLATGWPRTGRASNAAWGAYPDYALAAQLPEARQAKNVLEIFLYGGLCPW